MIYKPDIKKLKSIKPIYLVGILSLGVLLVVLSNFSQGEKPPNENTQAQNLPVTYDLEKRLEEIINSIDGVSDATVLITYENSGVKNVTTVVEESSNEKGDDKSHSYKNSVVTQKEGSSENPFVREEILPEIRGIIIAAKGVGERNLDAVITDAVSSAMGVSLHRVKILPKD